MPIVSACSCLFRKHADAPVSGRPEDIHRECGYHRAMREAAEQHSKSGPSVDDLMRTIYEIDKLARDGFEEDEDPQAAWEACRRITEKALAARILFANHKPNPNPSGQTPTEASLSLSGIEASGPVGLGPSQSHRMDDDAPTPLCSSSEKTEVPKPGGSE